MQRWDNTKLVTEPQPIKQILVSIILTAGTAREIEGPGSVIALVSTRTTRTGKIVRIIFFARASAG